MLIDLECFPSDQVAGVGVCLAPGSLRARSNKALCLNRWTLKLLVTYKPAEWLRGRWVIIEILGRGQLGLFCVFVYRRKRWRL